MMYANLRVEVATETEPVFAWKVEPTAGGGHLVHLDGNDGNGNYAEEAGTRELAPGELVDIQASF